MPIDFPSGPTTGQQYTYLGRTWEWNGTGWILVATASIDVTVGASAADVLSAATNELTADDPGADRLVFWDDSAGKLTYLTVGSGLSLSSGSLAATGAITQNSQTSAYTLAATDASKHVSITTGGVTVPSGVFSVGDAVTIYNNSGSNQTITQGASVTLGFAGTADTGNRTLAQYGIATVLCVASNVFVISGSGLT